LLLRSRRFLSENVLKYNAEHAFAACRRTFGGIG
jgi:hypothetical protein